MISTLKKYREKGKQKSLAAVENKEFLRGHFQRVLPVFENKTINERAREWARVYSENIFTGHNRVAY